MAALSPTYSKYTFSSDYPNGTSIDVCEQNNDDIPSAAGPLAIKTNDVAKRILIGASVFLACTSFLATFLISSTYLIGVALGIIMGVVGEHALGNKLPGPPSTPQLPSPTENRLETEDITSSSAVRRHYGPFIPGQPVGIPRNGTMNCWAISLMQFIHNIPSLYNFITHSRMRPIQTFYRAYDQAREQQQHVVNQPSSQTIRQFLHTQNSLISASAREQEDAHEGFMPLIEAYAFPFLQSDRPGFANRQCGVISVNIARHANRPLVQLLEQEFLEERDSSGGAINRFHTKPEELFFHIPRFSRGVNGRYQKNNDAINITPTFDLPDRLVVNGGGGQYECDTFLVHRGAGMNGGHYVTYRKGDNGVWWLCDDDMVTQVNLTQVQNALRASYLLHYRAVESV